MDEQLICAGCGVPLTQSVTALWYGRWLLCVLCKARSVTTGWLPADATADDHDRLLADRLACQQARDGRFPRP